MYMSYILTRGYFKIYFFCLSVAAAAAEMAYHTTRPPIAVTFPKPIVALLQSCWNASADVSRIVL